LKHGYGIKIDGTCYGNARRLSPMGDCTAYISFDNASISTLRTNLNQWKNNTNRVGESIYDQKLSGFSYNESDVQRTSFSNYCFDINDINSWGVRGVNCSGDPPICMYEFVGPKFKNNLAVIPLSEHKVNPISKLKKGRLSYNFLDANPTDIQSPLIDPLEFSGVYPYSPEDSITVRKPAGWMYSNKNVPEPYYTEINYEGGLGKIDRSTSSTTQLNFMPFLDPLRVFDLDEKPIGEFDGLAFILFYGETAFKLPFVDLPEYNGMFSNLSGNSQTIGLEVNIFLAGKNILSPRVGRLRWYLENKGVLNDPENNYFTTFFKKNTGSVSYIMPMSLNVKPSQLALGDDATKEVILPFGNLKIMVGA
jgi:hypothetical protein